MADVEIPDDLHESVKDFAQERGLSVTEAYVEIVEYGLRDIASDGEDEDDDLKSGIA